MTSSAIGRRLRIAREAAGLTQAEVARALGTSVPAISMIETGKRDPRTSTLLRYADVVGLEFRPREAPRVMSLEDAARQAAEGSRNLRRVRRGVSDPKARLAAKRKRGLDVSSEERALASR